MTGVRCFSLRPHLNAERRGTCFGKNRGKPVETQVSTRGKETFFAETPTFLPGKGWPESRLGQTPGPVEKEG